jgi:ribosomal protein S14
MFSSAALEREDDFLAPGQFWCQRYNQRLGIFQCINRQSTIEKSKPNSSLYKTLKLCVNCRQGKENEAILKKKEKEKKKYICEECGREQYNHLKLGMCNACHSRDYREKQKNKIETLEKKVSEMSEKLKDKEHQITLDFKKNPALLERIQCEAENDFREPWGQIMFILRERFEPEEKK